MSACRFPLSGARALLSSSAGSTPWLSRLVQLIPVPVGRVILLGCVILLGLDLIATAGTMVRMRRQFALTPEQMEALEQAASLPGTAQRSHPRTHPAPYGTHRSPALPA